MQQRSPLTLESNKGVLLRQAKAFALLGAYYKEVAGGDWVRARRCWERALSIDPLLEEAGAAL